MIIVGILGVLISVVALFAHGVFWIVFGSIFWGVILAFMLLDLSGSYSVVALYILFVVLNLILIYKITKEKK
ncbi:hypothetical protein [Campylobacter sp. US33a]|uniref:Uncharacterized protein n=1 Tax=Campylobacter sp. CCS1377 TaxID=3158229 RepID=A0AAU7E574_9BACT|nr:hypothetical protein [Campylobacter sp. US33a]MCW1360173.1 hypothetical protein [Campylobacter jejuni]TEY03897.1 hypothetical protein ELQ16_01240 [Campylobacter sp. US33a]